MTEHNHRRGTKTKLPSQAYTINGKPWGYPDKSMQGWSRRSDIADGSFGASIGNDFTNGHRGMARSASGAKKYVRSRFRFHEKAATKRLSEELTAVSES
jgi:hypothetical protein